MRIRLPFLAIPLLAVVLGACGGSSSSKAPTAGGATATYAGSGAPPSAGGGTTPSKGGTANGGGKAVDACSLVTANDVEKLIGAATAKPVTNSGDPGTTSRCRWEGAPPPSTVAPATIDITVSQVPVDPGLAYALRSEGASGEAHGRVIDGLGDVAVVESSIPSNAECKVLKGVHLLSIEYSGTKPDGVERQDDVVGLCRTALPKLG